MMEDYLLF